MITKRGYVFIAAFGEPLREYLFGPATRYGSRTYQSLESNRLTLFQDEATARKVMLEYKRNRKSRTEQAVITPARLHLKIADDIEEAERLFARKKDLIVIASDHSAGGVGDILMGIYVEGRLSQYPLPGARMIENGFSTIPTLERAEHISREAQRQSRFICKIALFKLKRL